MHFLLSLFTLSAKLSSAEEHARKMHACCSVTHSGHHHGEGHVRAGEEGDDVGRHASWAACHQADPVRQYRSCAKFARQRAQYLTVITFYCDCALHFRKQENDDVKCAVDYCATHLSETAVVVHRHGSV